MTEIPEIALSTTQKRVFDFMVEFGSITTKQAIDELGETRLSARIFELQEKGVRISAEWQEVKNRFGEKRRVKRYFVA